MAAAAASRCWDKHSQHCKHHKASRVKQVLDGGSHVRFACKLYLARSVCRTGFSSHHSDLWPRKQQLVQRPFALHMCRC